MKVFLSSTVLDLKDLRDTVIAGLTEDGCTVFASEHGTMPVESGLHTYEACIAAVHKCDALVAIIDSRFGGITPDGQTSITEAEIATARSGGKKVFVYVRQAVWDGKHIYDTYIGGGGEFKQTKIVHDNRVLGLIDRLRKQPIDNWLFQFVLPSDLLRQIRCQLDLDQGLADKRAERALRSIKKHTQFLWPALSRLPVDRFNAEAQLKESTFDAIKRDLAILGSLGHLRYKLTFAYNELDYGENQTPNDRAVYAIGVTGISQQLKNMIAVVEDGATPV